MPHDLSPGLIYKSVEQPYSLPSVLQWIRRPQTQASTLTGTTQLHATVAVPMPQWCDVVLSVFLAMEFSVIGDGLLCQSF
jgi:hypothetical protein